MQKRFISKRCASALVALAAVITACGDDAKNTSTSDASSTPTDTAVDVETSTDSAPTSAFPVTIPHKYGETVIAEAPERIVVVGLTEQDPLLALGVAPVAVTEWFGGHDYAAWPWAQPFLGDAQPVVLENTDGLDFEQIASLHPDVIIGLYAGITDTEYETLTAIAPTVAQPGEYVDWGISWQEETRVIGQIVGKVSEAEALIADVEAQLAAVRAEHPEFIGASAVVATPYEGIWVYAPEDVRGRFLDALGFEMPAELVAMATDEFGFDLSPEQVELLDVDALIWLDAEEAGDAFQSTIYESLRVSQEGRDIFLDSEAPDALGGATSFVTVLSLPYLIEGIVPMLVDALDGKP